jgi:hypothetical protein
MPEFVQHRGRNQDLAEKRGQQIDVPDQKAGRGLLPSGPEVPGVVPTTAHLAVHARVGFERVPKEYSRVILRPVPSFTRVMCISLSNPW